MAAETLTELVQSLTPREQEAVRQFIDFLRHESRAESPFFAAADEFISQRPDLLRRLAE
jgi:hypothetical protein